MWELPPWRFELPKPSGRHRHVRGSGGFSGLISRLSVNRGLSQFDRAVDDNNLGAENDRLIRLFQDDKRPPDITAGNRKCRKVRRDSKSFWVPQSFRLPGSGILIM